MRKSLSSGLQDMVIRKPCAPRIDLSRSHWTLWRDLVRRSSIRRRRWNITIAKHIADSALRYGHDLGVAANWHQAFAEYFLGHADRAQTSADQAMALSDEIGHPTTTCYAYFWLSWMHALQRTIEGGRRAAEFLISFADEHRISLYSAIGRFHLGAILVQSGGDEDEALRFLDEGERGMEAKRTLIIRPTYLGLAGAGVGGSWKNHRGVGEPFRGPA